MLRTATGHMPLLLLLCARIPFPSGPSGLFLFPVYPLLPYVRFSTRDPDFSLGPGGCCGQQGQKQTPDLFLVFLFVLFSLIGINREGNGNPLLCSCLGNPIDSEA